MIECVLPDHTVCTDDKLWFGVPLVVCDVIVCLQPDPLLPFSQKPVVTGFSFPTLHHCNTHTNTQDL